MKLVVTVSLLAGVATAADAALRWTPETGFVWVRRYVAVTPEEQLARARELQQRGKYRQAAEAYEEFLDLFPDHSTADQAQFGLAECYEARGKLAKANDEYQKLIANYRDSELYGRVVRKQYDIADRYYQQYVNRKGLGRLTAGRKLKRAIRFYEQVIENDPFGAGAAEAQYRLAECYFASNKLLEAKLEYEQVLQQFPSSRWARDARFYLALCEYRRMLPARYDQESAKNALRGFTRFLAIAADDDERTEDARRFVADIRERLAEHDYLIGRFYERRGRRRAALVSYETVLRQYPDTSFAEQARSNVERLVEEMTRAGLLGASVENDTAADG